MVLSSDVKLPENIKDWYLGSIWKKVTPFRKLGRCKKESAGISTSFRLWMIYLNILLSLVRSFHMGPHYNNIQIKNAKNQSNQHATLSFFNALRKSTFYYMHSK